MQHDKSYIFATGKEFRLKILESKFHGKSIFCSTISSDVFQINSFLGNSWSQKAHSRGVPK